MATKAHVSSTSLRISGIPSEIAEDQDYIEHYFKKKCGGAGGEVKLLSFSEADNTAVVSIRQLDDKGS